jgi:hypothetical protein
MKKSTHTNAKEQANSKKAIALTKQSPRVQRLRGIIKTNENLDYKQRLTEELLKEYNQ